MPNDKKLTITRLPGNPVSFISALESIFIWVESNNFKGQPLTLETLSEYVKNNLGWEKSSYQAARFVAATFMEKSNPERITLSDWAMNWLNISDHTIRCELLFEYLNDEIFFFGEILSFLDTPKSSSDLLDFLNSKYPHISWTTPGLLTTRLDWLVACEKVYKSKSLYCLSPIIEDINKGMMSKYREKLNIGELGEQYVLDLEKTELSSCSKKLSDRVRRVSTYAPRAGYDIQSYFPDGRLKFIEVKATTNDHLDFEMTHNEWQTAKRLGEYYYLYRLTNIGSKTPKLTVFKDPTSSLTREPLVWKVSAGSPAKIEDQEQSHVLSKENVSRTTVDSLLANLPRSTSIFALNNLGLVKNNRLIIEKEESVEYCPSCLVESNEIIRVGYALSNNSNYIIEGMYLCPDCLLKLRELLW